LVFASAALIGRDAIEHLMVRGHIENGGWGVAVMALSIVMTGGLIAAQSHLLRRTASVAVSADRAHYAADLLSNLIALLGIGGAALFHWAGLDALAGLAVGAILLFGAVAVFREASSQLMDHELPQDVRARIVALVTEDPRITDVHQLRTRAAGPVVHLQMHADLDPDISLVAAHQAVVAAEKRILVEFPVADIIIHADPRGRAEPHGGAFAENPDKRVELLSSAS
jgi:ferrous-iron efflux pump FieF